MYFCDDVDLLSWEPGIFMEPAFGHQAVVRAVPGTLTATALVTAAGALAAAAAGMVAILVQDDESENPLTQLAEIVEVEGGDEATVSGLRGRDSEPPMPPFIEGDVLVTVVSFRPQIAAVGDALLAMLGVASDRANGPDPASAELSGFRSAAIFGTLAAVFRTLGATERASNVTLAKVGFYEKLWQGTRRGISGKVDRHGDGVAEDAVMAGVGTLARA